MSASSPSAVSTLYRMFRPVLWAALIFLVGGAAIGLTFWCSIAAFAAFCWCVVDGIDDARNAYEASFLVALASGTAVYAATDGVGILLVILWFGTLFAGAVVAVRRVARHPEFRPGAVWPALAGALLFVALAARALVWMNDLSLAVALIGVPAIAAAVRYQYGRPPAPASETAP